MTTPLQPPTRTPLGSKRHPRIFYGWNIVGTSVIALAIIGGSTFQGLGIFFVALERHFGWSRTVLSGAFSLSRVEGAFLGPVEGYLTDHLGSRRMVLIGMGILGAGFVLLSMIQGVAAFYVAFLVLFVGAGLGGWLPLMTAINHWFARHRSKAMAIAMTGFNVGGLLVPGLAWLITEIGWRKTSLGLAVLVWVAAIPISMLVRNRPEQYGLRPDGDSSPYPDSVDAQAHGTVQANETDFTLQEALRTQAFWLITIAHALSVAPFIVISVHIIPALTDMGFALTTAAVVVSTYTSTAVIFQLVGGYLGDRLPNKSVTIAIFTTIQAASLVLAATMRTTPVVFAFAILFGMGHGGKTPLLTAIRGDFFGRKQFATILGTSILVLNLVTMGLPLLAGYLYDVMGSYTISFLGLAVLSIIAAVTILPTRKPAKPASRA